MKKQMLALAFLLFCIILSGCQCDHDWTEATCTEPKTCILCAKTEGEPLEHNWKAADCTTPEICSYCTETRGEAVGHTWQQATCTNPKTCSVCGDSQGAALGHKESNQISQSTDMINATVTTIKYCSVCSEKIDEQTEELNALHDTEKFLITPKEYVTRLRNMLETVVGSDLIAYSGSSADEFACGIYNGDDQVGIFLFANDAETIKEDDRDTICFSSVLGTVADSDTFAAVMIALVLTTDPTVEFEDATEIGLDALYDGSRTHNGVTYAVSLEGDGAIIALSIAK